MRALVVVALLVGTTAHAQPGVDAPVTPVFESEAPFIDIMTFGLGEVVFEKFGHAAICIRYHEPQHETMCFNFGVTDFGEGLPMAWNFLRGTQVFWVEPLSYPGMLAFYKAEDRDIYVQTLPLTRQQARDVERKLWASLTAPDARYHYDFFFENCTTRIRGMVDEATGGQIALGSDAPYPLTFRQLGERGLASLPPLIALSDFAWGRKLDTHPTVWEAMFHPDFFRTVIEQRLGAAPRQIYKRQGAPFSTDAPTGRLGLLAVGLLFALPILVARARGRLRLGLVAVYAAILTYVVVATVPALWSALGVFALAIPLLFACALGSAFLRRGETIAIAFSAFYLTLWGVVIWTILIITPITVLQWNEVATVMFPLDVILPFLGPRKRRIYARVRLAILLVASLLTALGVFVEPLWIPILTAFFPLATLAFDLPHGQVAPGVTAMAVASGTASDRSSDRSRPT